MSIDALGSSSTSSTLELLKELRAAKKAMEAAVQSGDMKSAQQNRRDRTQDTQSLQAARGTSATAQDGNPYRSLLKTDMSNMMSAVQGGNPMPRSRRFRPSSRTGRQFRAPTTPRPPPPARAAMRFSMT